MLNVGQSAGEAANEAAGRDDVYVCADNFSSVVCAAQLMPLVRLYLVRNPAHSGSPSCPQALHGFASGNFQVPSQGIQRGMEDYIDVESDVLIMLALY